MVLIVLLTGTLTNHVVDYRIRIDPHPCCSASLDHDTKLSTRSQAGVQSVADWLITVWKVSTNLMDFSFEVKNYLQQVPRAELLVWLVVVGTPDVLGGRPDLDTHVSYVLTQLIRE